MAIHANRIHCFVNIIWSSHYGSEATVIWGDTGKWIHGQVCLTGIFTFSKLTEQWSAPLNYSKTIL